MSVASVNPFSFLSEDSESPDVVHVQQKEVKPVKAEAPQQATRGGQRGRGGPANRGGRYYQRGGGAKTQTREGAAETEDSTTPAREERRNGDAGRARGRGGRGRGERGRGAPGGRGRPFDKHSQTGRVDSQKQVHQGWGGDEAKSELKAEEEGSKDAAVETPAAPAGDWAESGATGADEWGVSPAAGGDASAQEGATAPGRRQEEEVDNTLTLDEYLKQQKDKQAGAVPKLEEVAVRKANEGEDVFGGSVVHAKEEEDAYFSGKSKFAPKQRSKTDKVKETITFEGRFADDSRSFRGRGRGGDRGESRGRGRGGRGSGRGGNDRGRAQANGNIDVSDESHFPVLGA